MPTATTQRRDTTSSLKNSSGSTNRKTAKHQNHRYGRIRREGDEEIIREAQSDYGHSESEDTDEEDSFSESSALSMPESGLQSSSRSQPTPEQSNVRVSVVSESSEPGPSSGARLLNALREPRLDWSDAVFAADGDVPVVQFDEMGDIEAIDNKKNAATAESHLPKNHRAGAPSFRRPVGMTARQVYLKRLENDPAYTPRVGEFWGHDERLLEKDLRSLSGWWRGKWTGRGGAAPGFHDRGRGGFSHAPRGTGTTSRGRGGGTSSQANVDPVDQAWKHDGFEEMKKADEEDDTKDRTASEDSQRAANWTNTRGRGRGGFARGTGLPGRMNRSQSFASQSQPMSPVNGRPHGHARGQSVGWNRYEHAWTKHAVSFLFQDTLSKPRDGGDVGIRVRLPGQPRFNVVRVSAISASEETSDPTASNVPTPARTFIVRLPKLAGKEEAPNPENVHTIVPPIPDKASTGAPTVSVPTISKEGLPHPPTPPPSNDASLEVTSIPSEQALPPRDPTHSTTSAEQQPSDAPAVVGSQPKVVPSIHLITSFPPPAPSPAFSSPSYGHGPAPGPQYPLHRPAAVYPPGTMPGAETGVWYDPRMPYGYPTPPPPNHMYTPPPPMPHGHHHSHSMSHPGMIPQPTGVAPPYFVSPLQQGPPMSEYGQPVLPPQQDMRPPPAFTYGADGAMIDVQTGRPIFSLPKSAKVAIKKPTEGDQTSSQHQRNKSVSSASGVPAAASQDANARKEGTSTLEVQMGYPRPPQDMQTPVQGYVPGQPQGQPFWPGYQQPPPQGYYYPHQYGVAPHAQDYAYGQPMHGPGVPVHGYVQSPYEGGEYQPAVYY